MIRKLLTASVLSAGLTLTASASFADPDIREVFPSRPMKSMHACMEKEKYLSDISRDGASALEFCSAQAVVEAKRKPEPVDTAIDWLTKKNAENPAATQTAMNLCRSAGQRYGDLLNCMLDILGP